MHPRRKDSGSLKRRLSRAVVVLFLIYTGVDITIPQYHRDESIGIDISRTLSSPAQATETDFFALASESIPNYPQEDRESTRDEDCFCCCSHVMPSPVFVGPANVELVVQTSSQPDISIPTAPLHNPYHPPRST